MVIPPGYTSDGRDFRQAGRSMVEAVRFFWNATRGYRLRPWRSPYLRWRFETYTGKKAREVGLHDFWRLLLTERRQLLRFLRWIGEMKSYAAGSKRL